MNKSDEIILSISIVSLNNIQDLFECLDSISKHTSGINLDILIVAYFFSKENLIKLKESYPAVKIIISNEIRGYSENNNLALKIAKGKYCCVLNDDTILIDNMFEKAINYLNMNPAVAGISPIFLMPNLKIFDMNTESLSPWSFIKKELKGFFLLNKKSLNFKLSNIEHVIDIKRISGACFIVRTPILKQIDYMDENLFLGPDDADLGNRIIDKGYKIRLLPFAKIIHKWRGGQITRLTEVKTVTTIISLIQYFEKHYSKKFGNALKIYYFIRSLFTIIFLYMKNLYKLNYSYNSLIPAYKNVLKNIFFYKKSKDIFLALINKYGLYNSIFHE
jgi:GT2 family glycosyltransferase